MIPRSLTRSIVTALRDTPVVYLQGPRQTGKSTLAQAIARERDGAQYLSFDTAVVLAAAESDPEGFIAGLRGPVVIDEVQRAPRLALAIKAAVDRDRRAGRFLLTGSASVLSVPRLADSLAGRMELHTLWPFSQGEIARVRESFVDRAFAARYTPAAELPEKDLLGRLATGGYPQVLTRKSAPRRRAWFDAYVTAILQRDIRDLAQVEGLTEMPRLLALLASRAAELLNYADLGRSLAMPQSTLKRYMTLLETTFLIRLLPAWFANLGKRLTKSPKLLLTDVGLLLYLLDAGPDRLRRDRTLLGHVLENFVAMELTKQLGWCKTRCGLFHFRTEAGQEVDLVLEDAAGRLVGIEVKSTASLDVRDLSGLRALAALAGRRFRRGIVLYTGSAVVPWGKQLWAVPLADLWS